MRKLEKKAEPVDDVNSLAESIMKLTARDTIKEYSFLSKPLFSLKFKPDDTVKSIGASYTHLYYNPEWVVETYGKKNGGAELIRQTAHCVLHCLMLHPSMTEREDRLFNLCADAVISMMIYSNDIFRPQYLGEMAVLTSGMSLPEIMKEVQSNERLRQRIMRMPQICRDDHSAWFKVEKDETKNSADKIEQADAAGVLEQEWGRMLENSKREALALSNNCGSEHGDIFQSIRKPDRHSRFTYKDYIRRFAKREIAREDLETMDMVMYNWGMENLDDTPIVEFYESKEVYDISDIVIAMDMSGSCSGEIAANFLRQIYSLFDEMNITRNVNLHVVTFDTQIIGDFLIRNKSDADKVLEEYPSADCWGGTDFNCVFNYANDFPRKNHGKRLKALFFFSDGIGPFPASPTKYPTTFFIPEESYHSPFGTPKDAIPKWVETVIYDDKD